jgi:hypothetical protein
MERGRESDGTPAAEQTREIAAAPSPAAASPVAQVLALQRSSGNSAVARMVAARGVLARLPLAVSGKHDGKALKDASVGPGGTNHVAEVEVVADRLHQIAFLSNDEFGTLYAVYGSLGRDEVAPADRLGLLWEKLQTLEVETPTGIDPLTAQVRFGVPLSGAVGPGWQNAPADVQMVGLALQYAGIVPEGEPDLNAVLAGITRWRLRVARGQWDSGNLGASGELGLRRPILPSTVRERIAGDPAHAGDVLHEVVALRNRARAFARAAGIGLDQAEFYLRMRPPALDLERDHGVPHIFTLAHAAVETNWDPYPVAEIVFGITRGGAEQTLQLTREEVSASSKEGAEQSARHTPGWTFVEVEGPAARPGRWIVKVQRMFARARGPREALELYWGVLQQRNFREALGHFDDLDKMADAIEAGGWATASNYAAAVKGAIGQVRQVEAAFTRFEASGGGRTGGDAGAP